MSQFLIGNLEIAHRCILNIKCERLPKQQIIAFCSMWRVLVGIVGGFRLSLAMPLFLDFPKEISIYKGL